MVNPLYVSENAPRAIRGGLTGLYQLFITMGIMLAFWINYGSLLHISGAGQYLVPLAMQGLPAILLLVGMLLCNESPRWLAKQDRWEEARATLSRVRNLPSTHPYVENEFQDIVRQLEFERQLISGSSFVDLLKEMWFIPGNRKRALISIWLMICQQMTGTNAINYYAPQIFENLGITGSANGLFATGVYGIVKVVGCACFLVFVADSLGRRRSLLWTSIAQGLAMLYIGLYVRIAPPKEGEPVIPAGYFALVCIFLFAAFFQFGWGPVCWIYVSEIPTTRLRSLNVSFAAATQWLFNFVVARAVPNMLATVGANGYGYIFLISIRHMVTELTIYLGRISYLLASVSPCLSSFGSSSRRQRVGSSISFPSSIVLHCSTFKLTWASIGLSLEKMDDLFGISHGSTKESADESPAEKQEEIRIEKTA
jgi:sugar porter (SP) family MFS transporter